MRYSQPSNEDEFEEFCLSLLSRVWNCPGLRRYGHRGERQHGIDLLDTSGVEPLRAAQCKHHHSNKTLPPEELKSEVAKASEFSLPLGHYVVLTTAKRSAQTHAALVEINREHRATGRFTVELFNWEDIERLLDDHPDVWEETRKSPTMAWQRTLQVVESRLVSIDTKIDNVIIPVDEGVDAELAPIRRNFSAHDS